MGPGCGGTLPQGQGTSLEGPGHNNQIQGDYLSNNERALLMSFKFVFIFYLDQDRNSWPKRLVKRGADNIVSTAILLL